MGIFRLSDFKRLLHPHYFLNILFAAAFLVTRTVQPFCTFLYPSMGCDLDFRESEILMFLAIIIIFRTRKHGATSMLPYISTTCLYTKLANIGLFFYNDPRWGIIYLVLCFLHVIFLPEPTYQGPEHITYFQGENMVEELERDKRVTWLISFYAAWNPSCNTLAPIFAVLSSKYHLDNLRFGKIDVTRYPDIANKYKINTTSFSKQLPTIILFRGGVEVRREPYVDKNRKLVKFFFSEDNIIASFDLNNLYNECKVHPLKKGKAAKEAEIQENSVEDKKDQ